MALSPATAWRYHRQIDITDGAAVSDNYPLRIKLYAGAGSDDASNSILYMDDKCFDFPNDIRIGSTSDESTASQYNYWIEEVDATEVNIWVKLQAANTIYLFTNNETAVDEGDGESTFTFFDDFPGSSLDGSKWSGDTGDCSVADSIMTMTHNAHSTHTVLNELNVKPCIIRTKIKFSTNSASGVYIYTGLLYNSGDTPRYVNVDTYAGTRYVACYDGTYDRQTITDDLTNYFIFEGDWKAGEAKMYIDDELKHTATTNPPSDVSLKGGFYIHPDVSTHSIYCDWFFISKYDATPPTWDAFDVWVDTLEPTLLIAG